MIGPWSCLRCLLLGTVLRLVGSSDVDLKLRDAVTLPCTYRVTDTASLVSALTSSSGPTCRSRYIYLSRPTQGFYQWPRADLIKASQVALDGSQAGGPVTVRCPTNGLIFMASQGIDAFQAHSITFQVSRSPLSMGLKPS